mgnify:CR=1 FL=1
MAPFTPFLKQSKFVSANDPFTDALLLGASKADMSEIDYGAFKDVVKPKPVPTTKNDGIIQQAQNIADKAYGDSTAGDIDWGVASLLYFSKMAENASKPGATALGAGASAFTQPAAYIMAKDKEKQALEAKKGATVASLIPSLVTANKTKSSKPEPYTDSTGETVFYTNKQFANLTQQEKVGLKPYEKPTKDSTTYNQYTLTKNIEGVGNKGDVRLLNSNKLSSLGDNVNFLMKYEKPTDKTYKPFKVTQPIKIGDKTYEIGSEIQLSNQEVATYREQITEWVAPPTAEETAKTSIDNYTKLANPYRKSDPVKKYQELRDKYGKIKVAYENAYGEGLKPGVADLSMIFAYMKMLDPRSVVREGEQDQARATGGITDQYINTINRLRTGESLTDGQRYSFVFNAKSLLGETSEILTNHNVQAKKESQEFKTKWDLYKVVPDSAEDIIKLTKVPKIKDLKNQSIERLVELTEYGNVVENTALLEAVEKLLKKKIKLREKQQSSWF